MKRQYTYVKVLEKEISKLYLLIIKDLFDNNIVLYKTETEQIANLVLDTIKKTKKMKWSLER